MSQQHSHQKWKLEPWLHDDMHDSEQFHLHFPGLIPEQVKPLILASQATILVYYSAVTILFMVHVSCQPRISNSQRAFNRQKTKFILIWAPIMLIIGALSVLNIFFAQEIRMFQSYWLERLQLVSDFYPCTDPSLAIDLEFFETRQRTNERVYYLALMIGNGALVFTTTFQFLSHTVMMLRWYRENPKDGMEIARSI